MQIHLKFLSLCFVLLTFVSCKDENYILVQSTTSTRDSGLYEYLIPKFKAHSEIDLRVVAVGTGQAIRNARDCNGDVLLVHSTKDEEAFVEAGYSNSRYDLMYNDFVIIGPKSDPAKIAGMGSVIEALQKLAASKQTFASRGDDSGTNKAELRLWGLAGIDVKSSSGEWYLENGSGMGKTLTFAVGKGAYSFSDRATWTKFSNKQDFAIMVEEDPPMFNQYGVMVISKTKCPNVKSEKAKEFVDWLLSSKGQSVIGDYRVDGKQLFYPNAKQ